MRIITTTRLQYMYARYVQYFLRDKRLPINPPISQDSSSSIHSIVLHCHRRAQHMAALIWSVMSISPNSQIITIASSQHHKITSQHPETIRNNPTQPLIIKPRPLLPLLNLIQRLLAQITQLPLTKFLFTLLPLLLLPRILWQGRWFRWRRLAP